MRQDVMIEPGREQQPLEILLEAEFRLWQIRQLIGNH